MDEERPGFWRTLPGILTALAAVLTAVTGLYVAIGRDRDSSADQPTAAVDAGSATAQAATSRASADTTEPSNTTSAPARPAAVKPWADSEAVITLVDGETTTFRAEMLSNCISVGKSILLANGQDIMFERMRSLEVTRSDPSSASNARATVVVTLLDGRALNGAISANCGMFGYNDIGRFDFNIDRLRRIDFRR